MQRDDRERQLNWARFAPVALSLMMAGLLAAPACGGGEAPAPEMEPAAEAPAAEAAPMDTSPRVFFISPEDGATVSSPVHFMFGAENFAIEPVGEGEIHEGAGHHHIGIDTECLPAGEIIPQADPWVHFGDASAMIDVQMEPGEHSVCLQIGDGEHRTIEGLNAVVTFTVQ